MAQVLVKYSLDLQPDEEFVLQTSPVAEELSQAVYKEALLAGAHILVLNSLPGAAETLYKHASDSQLDHVPPVWRLISEQFHAVLRIDAAYNTRELSGVDVTE